MILTGDFVMFFSDKKMVVLVLTAVYKTELLRNPIM